MTDLAFRLYPR